MQIVKILLATIGGGALFGAALWFASGYPEDQAARSAVPEVENSEVAGEEVRAACDAEHTFHLERLRANKALKVVELGDKGTANIQRYLDLTMQTPVRISEIPRAKVWVAWQYQVVSIGGSLPAQGVIAVVQDDCALYHREGDADETLAIVNGEWSR